MVTIYLDVDGVINCSSKNPPRKMTGWEGEWLKKRVTAADGESYPIHWSVELVEALNSLASRDGVTFKWLTTWQDEAPKGLCTALGIDGSTWEVLHCPDPENMFTRLNGWWKVQVLQKDFIDSKPDKIIWIDDDLRQEYGSKMWVDSLGDIGRGLGVSPSPFLGMTKKHIAGILEFIDS